MQKRVLLVSAAVAVLGLAAAVMGFVAESAKSKAFVRYDGQRCVYRRTAAFWCGIAAAVLALTGMLIITAASRSFSRYGGATGPGRRRPTLLVIAWVVVVVAAVLFVYGAWRNSGGTSGVTATRSGGRFNRTYRYGCAAIRGGVFATAAVASAAATACAISAYVNLHTAQFAEPGVAMGQPQPQWPAQPYPPPSQFAQAGPGVAMGQPQQWQQPYPPDYPPVAYPAAPAHHGYGYGDGYAGKQPGGTS